MSGTKAVGTKAVMIFRAVFWIGLVALLMPHEPDLGLGRPGAATQSPATILSSAANALAGMGAGCGPACAHDPGIVQRLGLGPDGTVVQGLIQVKAQIDADIAARKERARHSL